MVKKIIGVRVVILPLSLGIVVIMSILFIKPLLFQVLDYRGSIEEGKKQLSDLEVQYQKLSQLKSEWQSMEEKKIIEVALPQDESVENFLTETYQRAARSGVIMSNFSAKSGTADSLCSAAGGAAGTATAESPSSGVSVGDASPDSADFQNTAGAAGSAASCTASVPTQVSFSGNWDQVLNFLKYSTDSNRIANLKSLTISPKGRSSGGVESSGEQAPSDVLSVVVTLEAYYQPKSGTSSPAAIKALASEAGFSENVLKKVQEIVYAPYEPPLVSETGERNIFK